MNFPVSRTNTHHAILSRKEELFIDGSVRKGPHNAA